MQTTSQVALLYAYCTIFLPISRLRESQRGTSTSITSARRVWLSESTSPPLKQTIIRAQSAHAGQPSLNRGGSISPSDPRHSIAAKLRRALRAAYLQHERTR